MKKNNNSNSTPITSIYTVFPETLEYANAYVPFQVSATLYDLADSLQKGTIFKELYQPHPILKGGKI